MIELSFPLAVPTLAIITILGFVLGSFVSALSYRLPRGQSIVAGRSRCTSCSTVLRPSDLIPVISWSLTGGRCRYCGTSISARYPLIETVTACLFFMAGSMAETSSHLLGLVCAVPLLMTIAVIDLETHRVPNILTLFLAGLMSIWRAIVIGDVSELPSALVVSGFVFLAFLAIKRVGEVAGVALIGSGDIKLFAAAAIGLPVWQFVLFCLGVGLFATMFALLWRALRHGKFVPLAPCLVLVLWLAMVFDDAHRLLG